MNFAHYAFLILAGATLSSLALLGIGCRPTAPIASKAEDPTSPVGVVREYWKLARKGDLDSAALLRTRTVDGVSWSEGPGNWEKLIRDMGFEVISIESPETRNNRASVVVEAKSADNEIFYLKNALALVDGKWRIYSIYFASVDRIKLSSN